MTVIVYRDGVMAADSQISGSYLIRGSIKKIFRTSRSELVGGCGDAGCLALFRIWLESERGDRFNNKDISDNFGAIVVSQDGKVVCYDCNGCPVEYEAGYYADGAGRDYAYGAMAVGANAEDAVRAAIKHSPDCGGDIQIERLMATPHEVVGFATAETTLPFSSWMARGFHSDALFNQSNGKVTP